MCWIGEARMKQKNHRDTTREQQSHTLSYARCSCALVIVMSVFCGLGTRACAGKSKETDPIEPPVAGQPVNFSGAIGSYAISMQAEPTALEAEERILLKVRIAVTGTGSLHQIERPDLRKLPQFNKRFEIENGAAHDLPKAKTREFEYRLRPRNAEVKQIPALPFVYFNPDILPAAKGYQWAYASAIPLTVKPRSAVTSAQVQAASAP